MCKDAKGHGILCENGGDMIDNSDIKELQERFDTRYVKRDDCDDHREELAKNLHGDEKKLVEIETRLTINNILTTAIATGIVALVIKVFMGG